MNEPSRPSEVPLTTPVVATAVAVLAGLLGFGWFAGTRAGSERVAAIIDAVPVPSAQFVDSFDGSGPIGERVAWAGSGFTADGGAARVDPAAPGPAIVLHDTGVAGGLVTSTIAQPADGLGIVFRAVDRSDHWRVMVESGTARLEVVEDDAVSMRWLLPSPIEVDSRIAVDLQGSTIEVLVDSMPVLELDDTRHADARRIGLIGIEGAGAIADVAFVQAPGTGSEDTPGDEQRESSE